MKCSPTNMVFRAIRYFLFPKSKIVDEKTVEIEHDLEELRAQKARTSEMIRKINQPDVLRSLVISMSSTSNSVSIEASVKGSRSGNKQ